jgi:hypothetical protein
MESGEGGLMRALIGFVVVVSDAWATLTECVEEGTEDHERCSERTRYISIQDGNVQCGIPITFIAS